MPQRTNDFQRLVYKVRTHLAAGATVTESKMLVDRTTEAEREVDVCVESQVSGEPVMICIECCDRSRVADITWVDGMIAKHGRLPTNALILASRSGFTSQARKAAEKHGVKAISFSEVDTTDFPALLGASGSLWGKAFTLSVDKVLVTVAASSSLPAESVAVVPDTLVYAANGEAIRAVVEWVSSIINSEEARRNMLGSGDGDHVFFEMRIDRPLDASGAPMYLQSIEPPLLRQIDSIYLRGPCAIKVAEIGTQRGTLDNVHVVWGKAELLGRNVAVVATKDKAGVERVSIDVTPALK